MFNMPCLVNVTNRAHGLDIYFGVDYNVELTNISLEGDRLRAMLLAPFAHR
jgi:hypothetical protein